jgi:hypothetical protein
MKGLPVKLLQQRIGASLLSSRQVHSAAIGNVMKLYSAHGVSEQERLEMGFYLQRMIVEGHKAGVDIYSMIQAKGGLKFASLGNDAIGHSGRMQKFITQATKQLVSSRREDFGGMGVTGAPRRNYNPEVFQDLDKQVSSATLGDAIKNCFGLLKTFQDQVGLKDPNGSARGLLAPATTGMMATAPATTDTMQQNRSTSLLDSMPRGVMAPQNQAALGTQPRSGIASAQPITQKPDPNSAQPGTNRGNKVLVYNGADWTGEANDMARQLKTMGYQVDLVSNLSSVNYDSYAALFMPGGNAGTEGSAIGAAELKRLSSAVNSGLNYFGSCAGAFLAGSYGSYSLGLVNKAFDYPTGSFGQTKSITHDTLDPGLAKAVGASTADILQYGGPALGGVSGAKTLATYPDGEVSIIEAMHGAGQVILTGGHPAVNPSEVGLKNVDDSALFAALAKATVTGTLPDGSSPGPTDPNAPAPGPNNNITNNVTQVSPTVSPQGLSSGGGGGGPQVRSSPNVPLSGMLDAQIANQTTTFAAALQSLGGNSGGGTLDTLGGSLARLRPQ